IFYGRVASWMNLPTQFFKSYLPKQDDTITLIDEDKEESTVKFKSESMAFGSGWKDLCTAHELLEEDGLVFQLTKATEFQVYIIRAYSLSGVDKDFGLRDSEAPAMQNTTCTPIRTHEKTELKCPNTLPFGTIPVIISDSERANSENNSRSSEVSGGVIFWGNLDRESLDVAVDGLRKNSELSKGMWTKYYELCRSQNVFLHGNLLKQNIKLRFENLVSESEHERYAKKHKEALAEFIRMEEWKRLDTVLLSLKRRAETHTQKFQEEVNAPW
ncbi:hypothetical protein GIB67_004902, partial [Kingdonia uniflora]